MIAVASLMAWNRLRNRDEDAAVVAPAVERLDATVLITVGATIRGLQVRRGVQMAHSLVGHEAAMDTDAAAFRPPA